MKNKQFDSALKVIVLVLFSLIPMIVMAGDPCVPSDPDYNGPCPIDGGISLLLAAGVGYGVKRFRDARKKDKAATV